MGNYNSIEDSDEEQSQVQLDMLSLSVESTLQIFYPGTKLICAHQEVNYY